MRRAFDRRAALAAIAACAVAPLARAQDPRGAAAQDAAREWLAIVDRLDAAASYKEAGAAFRSSLTPEAWAEAVKKVREPLGTVVKRTATQTRFASNVPGPAAGEYALIVFRSSFAGQSQVRERLTLAANGKRWQVVGYTIEQ